MEFELKRWKEIYTGDLCAAANDPDIARWMDDKFPHPFSEDDAAGFITARLYADDQREYSRAIVIGGHPCGCIHLTVGDGIFSPGADISFWLSPQWQGHGIMTAALREFISEAHSRLSIRRICARPFAGNTAARCVLNDCGFELEGIMKQAVCKDGVIHDVCIYALLGGSDV